ncbi:MAG TPA: diacylglycerol kinase family lipid kinase [Polyangiaceae bacterium]|nr:diacylglycerol kinase family lipid kinase [Polyangiaceae bacterium]
MNPLVILNPSSQKGKTGELAPELVRVIERYLGPVDRADTEAPRHAIEIAKQAAEDGRPSVIAVGGDGTIHEVVNGLMQARDADDRRRLPKLGVVGQGTGGDFRKSLGLDHRLDKYCTAIAGKRTKTIDVGRCRYRNKAGEDVDGFFINILSVGMGGLVDEYVHRAKGRLGGTIAYFNASVKALLKSEVGILDSRITSGGDVREEEIHTRQIAICNGRFFGGGMEVAPMAELDDGRFHVVSLGAATKAQFALGSLAIYSGKHVDKPEVEVFACERIELEIRNDSIRDIFPLDVDGEPLGTLPLTIEVVPSALDVFVG